MVLYKKPLRTQHSLSAVPTPGTHSTPFSRPLFHAHRRLPVTAMLSSHWSPEWGAGPGPAGDGACAVPELRRRAVGVRCEPAAGWFRPAAALGFPLRLQPLAAPAERCGDVASRGGQPLAAAPGGFSRRREKRRVGVCRLPVGLLSFSCSPLPAEGLSNGEFSALGVRPLLGLVERQRLRPHRLTGSVSSGPGASSAELAGGGVLPAGLSVPVVAPSAALPSRPPRPEPLASALSRRLVHCAPP